MPRIQRTCAPQHKNSLIVSQKIAIATDTLEAQQEFPSTDQHAILRDREICLSSLLVRREFKIPVRAKRRTTSRSLFSLAIALPPRKAAGTEISDSYSYLLQVQETKKGSVLGWPRWPHINCLILANESLQMLIFYSHCLGNEDN